MQWFLKMKELSKPALDAVVSGEVKLIPNKFINTYKYWIENVRDWCLSRQLWWGQRIPAWYSPDGKFVVAKTADEALKLFESEHNLKLQTSNLKQDEDVLDTWASSWLWPISVFDGLKKPNGDIKYYYPTSDLITAPEILFFWVARMIIAGYEYRKEKPFTNVYLTGIVRDKKGRKMSKQLGNSPEPLELIKQYSADGVRVGMLLCSPAGNDLLFEESYCGQGRNFANKIWNAFRLIKGWEVGESETPERNQVAIDWFNAKLNAEIENINDLFSKYRISEALMATYKLVWDDFCSWYLEMVKPDFVDGQALPVDSYTYNSTIEFFEDLLKLLHPFMPFISEELWHLINERDEEDCIIISEIPEGGKYDSSLLAAVDQASQVITDIRFLRKLKAILLRDKISLLIKSNDIDTTFDAIVRKLCNVSEISPMNDELKKANYASFRIGQDEYFIPLSSSTNSDAERQRLEQELEYNKGFLVSVQKKLSNERFIQSAKPEVVENEKKKQSDAEAKIRAIEERLASLS